ncbi:MAG: hypothetical protein HOQ12_16200 [Gemmatimonadaceae bacterium]|nr:hypothetical protein [Gemmatimonadaceae bacterium]NUQ92189.1 hypothetical protein [Gemmatimonadaceae bacterium]NUR21079.1 hypothetical protein [Gemmatimonadaceae bacterium]
MSPASAIARRSLPAALWINARARNVLRRPLRFAIAGLVLFIVSLLSLVALPRQVQRAAAVVAPSPDEWRDTARLIAAAEREQLRLAAAESSIVTAREILSRPVVQPAVDSLPPEILARRDSLAAIAVELSRLMNRVEQAPLAASYRALADAPAMRADPRVRALVDSLADVERERDAFGAVGGIDPNYVALTSRATTIGRAIEDVAEAKRADLQRQVAALTPAPPPPVERPVIDTLARVARRDSVQRVLASRLRVLAEARRNNADVDRRAERARELANVKAPPIALLGASVVIALALAFIGVLVAEMRRPRIADVREAERATNLRVLSTVREFVATPERARRRADRELPPLLEPGADGYRFVYLHLSGIMPGNWAVAVAGRDRTIAAVVAANLAALAALDARASVLIDADPDGCAAGVMRVAPGPGVGEITRGELAWTEAPRSQVVGRDRATDIVPAGRQVPAADIVAALNRDLPRLTRRYDTVVVTAGLETLLTAPILPLARVIVTARIAATFIADLARDVDGLRAAGAQVIGVVLWDRDEPHVPTREELEAITAAARSGVPAELLIESRVV